MGISTDAMLLYGFQPWAEEEEPDNIDDLIEDSFNSPIFIETHCSDGYPMYIVCVNELSNNASRGSPVEITDLNVEEKHRAQLREYCKQNNIEWQEPKWLLCSYWG